MLFLALYDVHRIMEPENIRVLNGFSTFKIVEFVDFVMCNSCEGNCPFSRKISIVEKSNRRISEHLKSEKTIFSYVRLG